MTRVWNSVPVRPGGDARWRHRIQQLLAAAKSGQPSRKEAILRLTYLSLRESLQAEERTLFGEALWSEVDSQSGLPADTGLLSSALANLPSPDAIDPKGVVCALLFQRDQTSDLETPELLNTQVLNQKQQNIHSYLLAAQIGLRPEPEQAERLFDTLVAWGPTPTDAKDPFGDAWRENFVDGTRRSIGTVLAETCLPALSSHAKNEERASRLQTWILKSRDWHGLPALPEFLNATPSLADDVATLIRRALVGSYRSRVVNGAEALRKWSALREKGLNMPVPNNLIDQLVSTIETRHEPGLQALLYTARYLLGRNLILTSRALRLLSALEDLWFETQYIDTEPVSRRAISLSIVRAECVRLAYAMQSRISDNGTLERWVDTSKSDPLPEVRNALVVDQT